MVELSACIAVPTPKLQATLPGVERLAGAGDDLGEVEVDDAVGVRRISASPGDATRSRVPVPT
jgi:hypothetical protein